VIRLPHGDVADKLGTFARAVGNDASLDFQHIHAAQGERPRGTSRELHLRDAHSYDPGFALPRFSWTVAGKTPPPPVDTPDDYEPSQITVTLEVGQPNPSVHGGYTWSTEDAVLQFPDVPGPIARNGSAFAIHNLDFPGFEPFPVTVGVTETYAYPGVQTSQTDYVSLDTQIVVWEEKYLRARDGCLAELRDLLMRNVHFQHLQIWTTLPDPPPDGYMARVIGELINELETLTAEEPELASRVAHALGQTLKVSPEGLLDGRLIVTD
jgi:hypothetical protein